jgi:hypothetical protein
MRVIIAMLLPTPSRLATSMDDVVAAQLGQVKPALEALGPYPILQFFAALIIMIVIGIGGLAWLRGEKQAKAKADAVAHPLDAPRTPEAAVQLFFDGPLRAIFDCLTRLEAAIAVGELKNKDATASLLSATRHGVIDAVTQSQAEVENSMEINRRDMVEALHGLATEVRGMRDIMIRIEANMMRRRH